jgi:hypothetical protein
VEDNHNGGLQWMMIDDLHGSQPQWKTTFLKDDLNGRQPYAELPK